MRNYKYQVESITKELRGWRVVFVNPGGNVIVFILKGKLFRWEAGGHWVGHELNKKLLKHFRKFAKSNELRED